MLLALGLLASLLGPALVPLADDVHPTLEQIFRPPRLLGVRPSELALSADGRFITYRWTAEDAVTPQLDLWLAPTDGRPARLLARAGEKVEVRWTLGGSLLLIARDGWISSVEASEALAALEAADLAEPAAEAVVAAAAAPAHAATQGAAAAQDETSSAGQDAGHADAATAPPPRPQLGRPLFEGAGLRDLELLEEAPAAVLVTGAEHRPWRLDLVSGERQPLAEGLTDRSAWFAVLEDAGLVALFARTPATATPSDGKAAPLAAADNATEATTGTTSHAAATDVAGGAHASGSGDTRRLHLVALDGAAPPRRLALTEGGRLSLSPDGRWALVTDFSPAVERQLVMADYLSEAVSTVPVRGSLAGDDAASVSLRLHDLQADAGFELPLDAEDTFHLRGTAWSPDGRWLLVDRLSNDWHVRQLLVVDPERRSSRLLFAERDEAWIGAPTSFAAWSDDGSSVLFTSEQSGFNHLYRAPLAGGVPEALTAGDWEVQQVHQLRDHDRLLLVAGAPGDPTVRQLLLVDLLSRQARRLTGSDGCAAGGPGRGAPDDPEAPRVSRDGSTLVYAWMTLGRPADYYALPLPTDLSQPPAAPTRLTHFDTAALDALQLVQPEIITYTHPDDGALVHAFLYRPEPFEPGQRYPLVVFVHGAGQLQNVTRSRTFYDADMLFQQRLARRGYAVLAPDFRHSAGYGRDFRAAVHGHLGGKDLDDVVAGVEHLVAQGLVDPARVGIYGGSYGGFLTLMALFTQPDVFAAGAALRSVTDWRTYSASYTNPRLGHPERDAENYRRSSPIDLVDGLADPLLLLHGLKDDNVFAQDSIRLMEALIQRGKDFDVMLYPSQGHGFTDPASWIDEYGRIERFFDRHLRGE